MRVLKKLMAVGLTATMLMTGCTSQGHPMSSSSSSDKGTSGKTYNVLVAIYPEYDWVQNLTTGVDNINVSLLENTSADLHNYQPSAEDLAKIKTCDLFIYNGGESDEWVEDALQGANCDTLNLTESLGDNLVDEEPLEGMQAEEEEEEEGEEGEAEKDEHIWLSVKNALILCNTISSKLSALDSADKGLIENNRDAYFGELNKLDSDFQGTMNGVGKERVALFADRFPFRYLARDYDIRCFAAFQGCSSETEASFETVKTLAKLVDQYKLGCVFKLDGSDGKIAKTVIENTKEGNQKVLTLDSMQSGDHKPYVEAMRNNMNVLIEGLSMK